MNGIQLAIIAEILPRLSDEALEELKEQAQFLLVRRHAPVVEIPRRADVHHEYPGRASE